MADEGSKPWHQTELQCAGQRDWRQQTDTVPALEGDRSAAKETKDTKNTIRPVRRRDTGKVQNEQRKHEIDLHVFPEQVWRNQPVSQLQLVQILCQEQEPEGDSSGVPHNADAF